MGTNYYLARNPLDTGEKSLHLGKSSCGWCFALHIYPEHGINTWDDLLKLIGRRHIVDEYGRRIPRKEFINTVTNREFQDNRNYYNTGQHPHYYSWSHFLEQNGAEEGPRNCLRSKAKTEYSRTTSHAEDPDATYTYHDYEFS